MTMHRMPRKNHTAGVVAVLAVLALAQPASAQEYSAVLTGYGSASYGATLADGDTPNDFSAQLAPILLFMAGDDLLFETEIEFEVEGDRTETALEYAQIEYLGFDRLQVIAGKFLLPFGLFSERLHPSWINKMPSMPLLYGHAHGGVAEGSLLPVLSDAGVMARWAQPVGEIWKLDVTAWVSQGPRLVTEEDAHDEGEDDHAHALVPRFDVGGAWQSAAASAFDVPAVSFGTSFGDNNENKMLGARVGLVRGGGFEVFVSGFHAMTDPDDFLDLTGWNLAAEYRRGPFELRGEGILLRQELIVEETSFETLEQTGYYVQAAHRFGEGVPGPRDFEPVVRWSQILDGEIDGVTAREGMKQLAVGLNYWLSPTVPVKAAYEINVDRDDRVLLQWAFGF